MAVEPISGSALALLGVKLANDAFGPSAKYLGAELSGLTKFGVENVKRVLRKAKARIKEVGAEKGAVPPRLILPILQSAYFCEDEVVASYLGGVLCSARSRVSRDDRAVSLLKVIDGLSTYAVRAHCIVYSSVLRQKKHRPSEVKRWLVDGHGVTVVFDERGFRGAMDFVASEDEDAAMDHAFISLNAVDLCREGTRRAKLRESGQDIRWMQLSLRGVELFCWGTGYGQAGIDRYFEGKVNNADLSALSVNPYAVDLGMVSYG